MKQLYEEYEKRKSEIENRMNDFKEVWKETDKRVFAELAFCLCTPQSRAEVCWEAVENLVKNGLLYSGNSKDIEKYLSGVRFHKNKAKYIVLARDFFTEGGELRLKGRINGRDAFEKREFLVKNIKGISYKEASHFLRNIGFGSNLAILDRHILKNLKKYGVIGDIKSLTKAKYLETEKKMAGFSQRIKIPLEHLDLLFWSMETGKIFK